VEIEKENYNNYTITTTFAVRLVALE